jgi:hypothetical protein
MTVTTTFYVQPEFLGIDLNTFLFICVWIMGIFILTYLFKWSLKQK